MAKNNRVVIANAFVNAIIYRFKNAVTPRYSIFANYVLLTILILLVVITIFKIVEILLIKILFFNRISLPLVVKENIFIITFKLMSTNKKSFRGNPTLFSLFLKKNLLQK